MYILIYKKIKRREIELDIEDIINYYIKIADLQNPSKEYLRALASYPNEEFRIIEKYIQGKIQIDEVELLRNLYRAREIDINGIII